MQKVSLAIASLALLVGCSHYSSSNSGTETGNSLTPGAGTANPASPSAGPDALLLRICQSVANCLPTANVMECQLQLTNLCGLPQVLGVPRHSGIATVADLTAALAQGEVNDCLLYTSDAADE